MLSLISFARSLCGGSSAKGEAPRSDGDTGGVSATDTPMLKLVRVLISKQRGRALARKLSIPEAPPPTRARGGLLESKTSSPDTT
ncbi:hypothetical protein TIFTF001_017485 [Ficus carica]|uniref:Uncharacterized protein n=1 Tax=Ficus carica TaxID=3494 RepID=A0AA88DJ16_FICCA|nr:hypothetical protein TIFTF001_017485 [Ficus carica]